MTDALSELANVLELVDALFLVLGDGVDEELIDVLDELDEWRTRNLKVESEVAA